LTYPSLNFRVGDGKRGFRIKGVKCVGGGTGAAAWA